MNKSDLHILENQGSSLVFLGAYTHYDTLPHYPVNNGRKWGQGFTTCRWQGGRLQPLSVTHCHNPAVMRFHPKLNVIYVLTECIHQSGYVTAYRVDPHTGQLTELGRLNMSGRSTCYITFDRDCHHAVVANYWDGQINVVALDEAGAPVAVVQEHQQSARPQWRQVVDREDHWANRQDGPHAHCSVFHPSYRWLFVPDLGDNCIHQYGYEAGRITHQGFVQLPPGDGPRHLVFHPTLPVAYSGCELRSHVQVFSVDESAPGEVRLRLACVQHVSTLPAGGFEGKNWVGEIKVDAGGRFLYVSNRGHDSIAVFKVDQGSGQLEAMGVCPTLGACPRHFGLSPCGGYALVANQDSDAVRVFRVHSATGLLEPTGEEHAVACPNFVLFVRPHAEAALPAGGKPMASMLANCSSLSEGGEAAAALEAAAEAALQQAAAQSMPTSPIPVLTTS